MAVDKSALSDVTKIGHDIDDFTAFDEPFAKSPEKWSTVEFLAAKGILKEKLTTAVASIGDKKFGLIHALDSEEKLLVRRGGSPTPIRIQTDLHIFSLLYFCRLHFSSTTFFILVFLFLFIFLKTCFYLSKYVFNILIS